MSSTWLGTETEHALIFISAEGTPRPSNRILFDCLRSIISQQITLVEGALTANFEPRFFMGNGGCFYFEWHPNNLKSGLIEFATPECLSPLQLLRYKKAQQKILKNSITKTELLLNRRGYQGRFKILKNSRDVYGNVYGEQENFLIEAASNARYIIFCLIAGLFFLPVLLLYLSINIIAILPLLGALLIAAGRYSGRVQGAKQKDMEIYFNQAIQPVLTALMRLQNVFFGPFLYPLGWAIDFAFIQPYRRVMTAHLVSRIIYSGCGTIEQGDSARFKLAEKPLIMNDVIRRDLDITVRPIFETHNLFKSYIRMMYLIKKDGYRETFSRRQRLQINLSDSNMAEVSDYLKVASSYLVVEMVKAGFEWDVPQLVDPLRALKTINDDPSLRATINTNMGDLTALQLQMRYLEAVKAFLSRQTVVEPEYLDIVNLWEKTLTDLQQDPGRLFGQVDWITKYYILTRSSLSLASAEAKKIDLKYHELGTGYYEQLDTRLFPPSLVTQQEVDEAIEKAPNTRAALRSRYIHALLNEPGHLSVNWHEIKYKEKPFSRAKVFRLDDFR